jgi:hypothetical protein
MSGSIAVTYLQQAADLLRYTHFTLSQKGYADGLIEAAMDRARGMAEYKTRDLSPDLRGPAFLQVLQAELGKVETWMHQIQAALDAP